MSDKEIVVIAGKKIPIGTKGIVFWHGSTKYGERLGFNMIGAAIDPVTGKKPAFWIAPANVKFVNLPPTVEERLAALEARVIALEHGGATHDVRVDFESYGVVPDADARD